MCVCVCVCVCACMVDVVNGIDNTFKNNIKVKFPFFVIKLHLYIENSISFSYNLVLENLI